MERLEILWQDEQLVAVDKPPGLAAAPGRDETDSVLERLARQLKLPSTGSQSERIRLIHRLDKDTSGVMLLAKNIAAQRALCRQFLHGEIEKEYLAIVAGRPADAEGIIDTPLAPHPKTPRFMAPAKAGRPAVTLWRREKFLGPFALLRCFPKTGRTHQIRVHLKSIGLPLAVDPLYNPVPPHMTVGIFLSQFKSDYRHHPGRPERPLLGRLSLHAVKLTFTHPDGTRRTIECAPPKDFRATINQFSRSGRGGGAMARRPGFSPGIVQKKPA